MDEARTARARYKVAASKNQEKQSWMRLFYTLAGRVLVTYGHSYVFP